MVPERGISLSISIREPKPASAKAEDAGGISLSISIREPKRKPNRFSAPVRISLSISIREPKPRGCKHRWTLLYQFINIHQRTKTGNGRWVRKLLYQFINIHQRTKTAELNPFRRISISLSISIREPKPLLDDTAPMQVSVYQYPSENQNTFPTMWRPSTVSVYQYPSENQNIFGARGSARYVSVYQYPSENQNPRP